MVLRQGPVKAHRRPKTTSTSAPIEHRDARKLIIAARESIVRGSGGVYALVEGVVADEGEHAMTHCQRTRLLDVAVHADAEARVRLAEPQLFEAAGL
jgi:hypothetical protein